MDYTNRITCGSDVVVNGVRNLDLAVTLDCGQCFRWNAIEDNVFEGVVLGTACKITQDGSTLRFHDTTIEEFDSIWHHYFDFDRDYNEVKKQLGSDNVMARAAEFSPGIRVLRQPPWETLCSFILSANNNISRIKGIVQRLCDIFGEPVEGSNMNAFPTAEKMAALTEDDLAPLRSGYRAAYLIDAAQKVHSGQLDFDPIYTLPIDEATTLLRTVKGVGPKVAACVLLYGFARAECVPEDVWIKRALATHYPTGLPPEIASVAGLGQQYLFHYVRHNPHALEVE